MIVELNGVLIKGRIGGLDQFKTQLIRRETDKRVQTRFTSELELFDDGFTIISDELITPTDGLTREVRIRILDDCCGFNLAFMGVIPGDQIDWCEGECSVRVEAVERTTDSQSYNCLRSTYVWDNALGFQNRPHPQMAYCMEIRPTFVHDLLILYMTMENFSLNSLIFVVVIVALIIAAIGQLCLFINIIINAINLIPGVAVNNLNCPNPDPVDIVTDWLDFRKEMNERVTGCGRVHTSPLVRDYIKNACDICGLSFTSTILTRPASDYYTMVWLQAPVRPQKFDESGWVDENKPLLTGEAMLNKMAEVFNGDWWLKDGVVEFERRDRFVGVEEWINVTALGDDLVSSVCFEWLPDPLPAVLDIQHQEDFSDEAGNEALSRYNDIVDVNTPFKPNRKGIKEIRIPFAGSRNRDDLIDRDVVSFWASRPIVNSLSGGVLSKFPRTLIMSKNTAFTPKLLIWDGVQDEGRVKAYEPDGSPLTDGTVAFNYPLWVDHTRVGNLYDRFWAIEDPRVAELRTHKFEFTFRISCQQKRDFDFLKFITLKKGGQVLRGIPTEVEIDYSTRTATVTGII